MATALLSAWGIHDLALFAFTVLVLNATPGVDLLFVVSRTLAQGRRAGVAASLGIGTGCLVHTLAAAFGLAALLAVSTWAFSLLRWIGAAYLVWLASAMLRAAVRGRAEVSADATGRPAAASAGAVFRQGLLTNLLNPKVALFVLALLPQFILPAATHKTLAFLALGSWLVLQGTLFLLALVMVTARLRRRAGAAPRRARWLQGLGGLLFLGLAARLALGGSR